MARFSCISLAILGFTSTLGAAPRVDYLRQIKPILAAKCYSCHGALKQEAGLRLETRQLMLRGGDSGPVVVPGKAVQSLLVKRLTAKDERMPPAGSLVSPLTQKQLTLVRQWINQGASAPNEAIPESPDKHWAFQPLRRPQVPAAGAWTRNPIDAFIARQYSRQGLKPQRSATRLLQLRRLYFDLIGVPPPLSAIAKLNDADDRWYERTVDQLLNDPRYGERWGRHWMDIWRYSDWWGLGGQLRNSQKHIWHWRDWIVESLNADLPYDEMVRQMLAADELYPNDLSKLRATGFLARNYFLFNRQQWLAETVEHVNKAFLALTVNCAKCHDHKFDPIKQTDYYRMRAIFEPYHVRTDVLPNQVDLKRNGVPRVFDGLPKDPTYLFIRGDEKNPDKSRILPPGVPQFLSFRTFLVRPVKLPASAWQPGRRAWVTAAQAMAAQQAITKAQTELDLVRKKLANAAKRGTSKKKPKAKIALKTSSIDEDFSQQLDSRRWQIFGGDWRQKGRSLEQRKDGKQRAALRLVREIPRDFEATLDFTFLGGSMWRSVGLGFDSAELDPTKATRPRYHEQNVYMSAWRGGAKVHAMYTVNGRAHFPPPPAVRVLPLKLNRRYSFKLRVRGQLINAYVNNTLVIACRTPVPRRSGKFQITTFDVLARFARFRLRALPATVAMTEPAIQSKSFQEKATNKGQLAIAQARLVEAQLRLRAIELAAASYRPGSSHTQFVAAVKATRRHALARMELALATGQTKPVVTREQVQRAKARLADPIRKTDPLIALVGAKWTPTRFASSTKDDPAVKFQPYSTGRRRALAEWITDRRNPLAARVAANHIWNRHMGRPLVPTVFDFGRHGAKPTHPELLDWLAAELIAQKWSMKHLHRLIVTSQVYRLGSSELGRADNVRRDPDNRYWWRRLPVRLESQVIRDSVLALADRVDWRRGGPPLKPPMQPSSHRRSLYFEHANLNRNRFLMTFDDALVTECYRRERSVVPQQALALTNSQLVLDSARQIATRLSAANDDDFVQRAFVFVLGIRPSPDENRLSRAALQQWRTVAGTTPAQARANLVWALLNHNDFVTQR